MIQKKSVNTPSNIWTVYHNTTAERASQILNDGFQAGEAGRFGAGIYFFAELSDALNYAPRDRWILETLISAENLYSLDYLSLSQLVPGLDLAWEEEEGWPDLKPWLEAQGYTGACIRYPDESCEIVIYDAQQIQSVRMMDELKKH